MTIRAALYYVDKKQVIINYPTKKIGSTGDNQGSTTEIALYGHGTGIYLLSKKIGSTS